MHQEQISTHAPAGGATKIPPIFILPIEFLLTPLREGRLIGQPRKNGIVRISTHAPAGGATCAAASGFFHLLVFLLTPLREGRHIPTAGFETFVKFLLTPLREGRHFRSRRRTSVCLFLLTPLREGRRYIFAGVQQRRLYFYSRPCGRGDGIHTKLGREWNNFYSRPCGRGDGNFPQVRHEVLRQIAER